MPHWHFTRYQRRSANPKSRIGWRLTAPNGRIVAASSEGFSSWRAALKNARRTLHGLALTVPR